MNNLLRRQEYNQLGARLKQDFDSFKSHIREIGENFVPRRPEFMYEDSTKGDKRYNRLIDNTPLIAVRTASAGMMGGITSPSRPWFKLQSSTASLNDSAKVKKWLDDVTILMSMTISKSNFYNQLPVVYTDMLAFATSALLVEEDFEEVSRCYPIPIGSYYIATDDRGKGNTFFRVFNMTVRQIVKKFGMNRTTGKIDWKNISDSVKSKYENNEMTTKIQVCHIIAPNADYLPGSLIGKRRQFISVYYEQATDSDGKFLSDAGYDYFPVLTPRWAVTGNSAWGVECPCMIALGDAKALQLMQKRMAEAVDKMVRPPMKGPTSLKTSKPSILPGEVTYDDTTEASGGLRPVFETNPRVQELMIGIQDHQKRINTALFVDLWLMITNDTRNERATATEIHEGKEEKLIALGPVYEQLNQDLLDPYIELMFSFMLARGMIPEVPEELQGQDIKVEYISIMAQAQKLIGIGGIERMVSFTANLASMWPEAAESLDADETMQIMADRLSIPPGMIKPPEELEKIRAAKAQADAKNAQAASAMNAAKAVKDLAGAKMGQGSALDAAIDGAEGAQA